ncbi:MAG: 3-phosphoshikimate 1-carboxyvinyltransferase [Sorangiineae bacterium]|nr:3-phosphoshikimate 1-carboxyvinyltransferase [Polyangiaceae bacterium]MEB2322803.1 3-phosphoshikimate 1-carboxyvinyltransferase [Sorangiineae bacterium]
MARLVVKPVSRALTGSVPLPSDKSIAHRALIFAALSAGVCELRGFSYAEDNVATLRAFESLGVECQDDHRGTLSVHGVTLAGLRAPKQALYCGNSGTTMRLLSGVLSAQRFLSRLTGDASLSRRPMARVVDPLRARGALIEGAPHPTLEGDVTAPLVISPLPRDERLLPIEANLETASAQVKSALLLSGLFASGPTMVREPLLSRDHTERMLDALGMPIEAMGPMVSLHPPASPDAIRPFDVELPGDLSAAAFLLVAATLVEGSVVTTRNTGLNPSRAGIIDILRAFGGVVGITPKGDSSLGEPFGEVTAQTASLRGVSVGGELALRGIDEIPIACALAARAAGKTEFHDLRELRVKETDRIAGMVDLLRAFDVEAYELVDGLQVEGRPNGRLRAARVSSGGDHRLAMTAAVLGLVADGETIVDGADCIGTSFPRFVGTLRALGAELEVRP